MEPSRIRVGAASLLAGGIWAMLSGAGLAAPDLRSLCAVRAAIERVYYEHRLGVKPPFEQIMPADLIEQLVRRELKKEAVLHRAHGVGINDSMVAAEVQRINTTTRAPEILADLKRALGDDPARFARCVARPIVVDRLLRERFDNDDRLHSAGRGQAETLRGELLKAAGSGAHVDKLVELLRKSKGGAVNEITWHLPSLARTSAPPVVPPGSPGTPGASPVKSSGGPYTIVGTVQSAVGTNTPGLEHKEQRLNFADLPPRLQQVVRAQLRQPGDISVVIETPSSFLLYVLKTRTEELISVAGISVAKRGLDEWLAAQPD